MGKIKFEELYKAVRKLRQAKLIDGEAVMELNRRIVEYATTPKA